MIALLNGLLGWAGDLVGLELSFQIILGWLFAPVSWLIGVPGIRPRRLGRPDRHQDRHQRVRRLHRPGAGSDLERVEQGHRHLRPVRFRQHLFHGDPHRRPGAMVPERKSFIARYGMRAILAGCWQT